MTPSRFLVNGDWRESPLVRDVVDPYSGTPVDTFFEATPKDILEAIQRIEKYARKGKSAFLRDELIQNWMVNHISMIGEACRALPEAFQASHSSVL